jgi:hypothetical protein
VRDGPWRSRTKLRFLIRITGPRSSCRKSVKCNFFDKWVLYYPTIWRLSIVARRVYSIRYICALKSSVYALFSSEYPPCHPFQRCPAQCSERIALRSSSTHILFSILRPCCSLDRGRCQCRLWCQGVPGKGREVHESRLQVRRVMPVPGLPNSRPQRSVSGRFSWALSPPLPCFVDRIYL